MTVRTFPPGSTQPGMHVRAWMYARRYAPQRLTLTCTQHPPYIDGGAYAAKPARSVARGDLRQKELPETRRSGPLSVRYPHFLGSSHRASAMGSSAALP